MKKLFALLMVAMLALSLVACGGDEAPAVDNDANVEETTGSKKDAAIEAFNKAGNAVNATSETMNKLAEFLNENLDTVAQEDLDTFNNMTASQEGVVDELNGIAEQLNSDEVLEDEVYDALITSLETIEAGEVELKGQLDELYNELTK